MPRRREEYFFRHIGPKLDTLDFQLMKRFSMLFRRIHHLLFSRNHQSVLVFEIGIMHRAGYESAHIAHGVGCVFNKARFLFILPI